MFVGLEDGLEGLLHISELADHKVDNPESVVKVGEEVEVKILRVDTEDRKIGLSRRRVDWSQEQEAAEGPHQPLAPSSTQEQATNTYGDARGPGALGHALPQLALLRFETRSLGLGVARPQAPGRHPHAILIGKRSIFRIACHLTHLEPGSRCHK